MGAQRGCCLLLARGAAAARLASMRAANRLQVSHWLFWADVKHTGLPDQDCTPEGSQHLRLGTGLPKRSGEQPGMHAGLPQTPFLGDIKPKG